MKKFQLILNVLRRPLVLGLLALACFAAASQAATMDMWVYTGGKWALIVPGSNTGGRVVFNSTYGVSITDRAARGEYVEVDFWSSTARETKTPTLSRCWLSSTAGTKSLTATGTKLPATTSFTVPTSAAWDNIHVNVRTASGNSSVRLPVGSR